MSHAGRQSLQFYNEFIKASSDIEQMESYDFELKDVNVKILKKTTGN